MMWAHAIARYWAVGIFGVAAFCGIVLTVPALAIPDPGDHLPASAKWLNRQFIADSRGVNYLDSNTFDLDLTYIEQTSDACPNAIRFLPQSPSGNNSNDQFFFRRATYTTNYPSVYLINEERTETGTGRKYCAEASSTALPIGDPDNRRITWTKNNENQITNIFNGISFSQQGTYKGVPRYFRDSEIADVKNSCPDMILLHAADAFEGGVLDGDTAEFLFGKGDIPGSSILFSVEKNSDLDDTSETFKINGELDSIDVNTCYVRGSALNKKATGEYAMGSKDEDEYDLFFRAAGLDQSTPPGLSRRR